MLVATAMAAETFSTINAVINEVLAILEAFFNSQYC